MKTDDILSVLKDVNYKGLHFIVGETSEGVWLQPGGLVTDNQTGDLVEMTGRKWLISGSASPSEVVQTAFKAVMGWEEHEVRETFLYKGKSIFGPHQDIENLHAITE